MSSSRGPELIPLTGADAFLRAFDDEIRRCNRANHISQLVLRLGPGFDVGSLRKILREITPANPILSAPVRRRFGLGPPAYRIDKAGRGVPPRLQVHDAQSPERSGPGVPPLFFERLNERHSIRRGDLLRLDAVRYSGGTRGTDLALSWAHMLLDGSGSEEFVRFLDACARGERRPDSLRRAQSLGPAAQSGRGGPVLSLRQRGDLAREWQTHMEGFAAHPLRSLSGPRRRVRQALRYHVLTLDPAQTEHVVKRAVDQAGFLTPMLFYMAATIRAHYAVFQARGVDPGSFVVPLPVSVRPKGAEGEIFRTQVSLLWFQVLPRQADDFQGLLEALKEQRLASIKAGFVESGIHAMDFARYAPKRVYAYVARRSLRGELCSFFFAYTADFLPGLEHFLGAPIENAFHVPPVPPSPGSSTALSLRGGRLNVTHVYQEGVFNAAEHHIFRDQLRTDLLGE
ncbi:MAG: hypothetical protein O7A09_12100 [Proteobacteria bacterium]|nr:hypothetical protein [Pseudomonadota bacterium]